MLATSGVAIVVLTAGIIGAELAPSLTWATLPASLMIVGLALMTIPAAMIMKRIGRRKGFLLSAVVAGYAPCWRLMPLCSAALPCSAWQ